MEVECSPWLASCRRGCAAAPAGKVGWWYTGVLLWLCFAAARAIEQVVSLILIVLTRLEVINTHAHVASFTKGK